MRKSLPLVALYSMNSRNSPAGWRCSRTRENLVGLVVRRFLSDLGARVFGFAGRASLWGPSSSDEEPLAGFSAGGFFLESKQSW